MGETAIASHTNDRANEGKHKTIDGTKNRSEFSGSVGGSKLISQTDHR